MSVSVCVSVCVCRSNQKDPLNGEKEKKTIKEGGLMGNPDSIIDVDDWGFGCERLMSMDSESQNSKRCDQNMWDCMI